MARIGVDYATVKHAAIKLLSQGINPSVQKVRDLLGTGSNTTIAEHLSQWREEHAQKTVHHLPSTMPEELIAAMEVLWQTAMEQAEKQLASYKTELNSQHTQIQQEGLQNQQQLEHAKQQLVNTITELNEKNTELQTLHTNYAVITHHLEQKDEHIKIFQQQYETRLQRAYQDKEHAFEKNQQLLQEIKLLQTQLNNQAQLHQSQLQEARQGQENSEARWLILIDQARQETKELNKKLEHLRQEKDAIIEKTKTKGIEANLHAQETNLKLTLSLKTISELESKLTKIKEKHKDQKALNTQLKNQLLSKNKSKQGKSINKNSNNADILTVSISQ